MRYPIGSAFVCGAGGSEPLLSTRTVRRLKAGARVTLSFGPDARPAAHVTCDRGARLLRGGAQTCCTPFGRGGRTGGALNVAPKPGVSGAAVSGPRNIPGVTGTLRGMGGGLLARCRRLGQGTPLGVSSPGFGLAVLTANKKRPVLPASPRWRGAAGPGAVSGLRQRTIGEARGRRTRSAAGARRGVRRARRADRVGAVRGGGARG